MHKQYMSCIEALEVSLSFLPRFQWLGAGIGLKHKTQCLVEFDREIVLAQRAFDMSESVRNSPIAGDSNDMNSKPKFITLDNQLYVSAAALACITDWTYMGGSRIEKGVKGLGREASFQHNYGVPGYSCSEDAVPVELKREAGTISCKIEVDTSEVKAVCKTISETISETLLNSDLLKEIRQPLYAITPSAIGQGIIEPAPFNLQHCTINIPGVRIGDLDKPEVGEPVMSIDAMAAQHYENERKHDKSPDDNWKEAYRVARLRAELRKEPEYIQSVDFGKPGKAGWRLYKAAGRMEFTDEQGTVRAVVNPCK